MSERRRWKRIRRLGAIAAAACLAPPTGAEEPLPGIGIHEVTPETFAAFTFSVKMIAPPDPDLPQAWFSASAEFVGTVASATPTSASLVEAMLDGAHDGLRIRVTGTSPAAGQIREIATNHSSTQIDLTSPFSILPEPGDGVEVFTGQLPPGRWDATCTRDDPCLDIQRAHTLVRGSSLWLWFDSGDVWDSDEEWCDAAHRPPGGTQDGGCEGTQNRLLVQALSDPALENDILWAVSGTDLTGATHATLDCDATGHYPVGAGGLFENQNGSNYPTADDGPTGWLLVQGMESRCWNRPAPGTATQPIEWGEGTAVYRQEFSGKILAIHNRHGDLWDGGVLVSMNGSRYTQGDRYVGGIVLVDVEAHTADYSGMAGHCVATNDPYRSCDGPDFTGVGRASGGATLRPRMIEAFSGGDVLWVGGAATIRNKDPGSYPGAGREFVQARGFHDFDTNSGAGGSQSITLVNLKLAGGGPDASSESVMLFFPGADRYGTRFEAVVVNSSFQGLSSPSAVAYFLPGTTADRGTDTSLDMHWMNVSVTGFGKGFRKDRSSYSTPEIDGGARWTARCLLFDDANPRPLEGGVLEILSSTESLSTRCSRNFVDVQGWMDGDDAANQIQLCEADVSSYASQAMGGTLFQPGNAGDAQGWQIFSQGNSGDWGGGGVDLDVSAAPPTSPEILDAVDETCSDEVVHPLGQTLPIGFLSTPSNLISYLRVSGVRDLGFNQLAPTPAPTQVPGSGPLGQGAVGLLILRIGSAGLSRRRGRAARRASGGS